ncbi:MAG: YncE family protein [Bacteroidetes bacterium]|nr:YncE family protein [Bacteroidota bacterium]
MKIYSFIVGFFLLLTIGLSAQEGPKEFSVQKSIAVSGNGSWDYLTFDNVTQRIFVSHGTCVQVIDLKTGKQVGVINNTPGVHGIALAREFGKGFISAGKIDSVIVFDLKTYQVTGKIPTGKNPDAILYDMFTQRVFVFNAKGNSITVIGADSCHVDSTVLLRGNPEFAVTDLSGTIYVNIENLGMVTRMDAKTLKIRGIFPLGTGTEPTGMALDKGNDILFCGCSGTNEMVAINVNSGEVIARVPIGVHCDGVFFMPAQNEIYTSNGEGSVTVIRQESPVKYTKIQTLITKRGARTITGDYASRTLYIPTAEYDDVKKEYKPGSFQLLVISR